MFFCCECCVSTDHSSRGVLPTVARLCVWYRNLENEEANENKTTMGCNARKANKQTTNYFLLLIDNIQSLNEADHVITTRFQHLLRPQLGCLTLWNSLIIGSFTYKFVIPLLYQIIR
jgi:hypothetical protein